MILTPSNTGNLVAGAGLGIFAWSAFLKADKIPWLKNLLTTRRKEMTLDWIDRNKGISLLGLEAINLGSLTSESAATGESQFAMDCNGKRNMLYFDMRPYIAPYFDRHGGFSTDEALR
jgi:hypothetical protein